jgi:serine/threonine protein kinase
LNSIFSEGTKCGEWTIRQYLDGSGQSEIYIADRTDLRGNKLVAAIRTIKFSKLQSKEHLNQVQHAYALEYEALDKFNSDFIAKVYDYGVSPHFWIATEFVQGESLAKRLSLGPVLPGEWHSISKDAIRGLMHAHDRKVVHQDVKPGNIMIRSKDGRAQWIDFGSASIIGSKDEGYDGTAQTLPYVAPERMDGTKRGDSASDLYSLGVMLYEAAVGQIPWDIPRTISSQQELRQAFYTSKIRQQVNFSGLNSSQATLIQALLNPDPKKRPNAQQALKMLGAPAAEIHGGTIIEPGIRKKIEKAPAKKARVQSKPPQTPKVSAKQVRKTQPAKPVKPAKTVDKVKRTSLLLLILTGGLLHPISTWSWYAEHKSKKYLVLATFGTALSLLYLTGTTVLPKEIDPQTGASTVEQQYSAPLGMVIVALLSLAIYAHINRPKTSGV